MPLVPLLSLLGRARSGGYAIGYFEAWDSYSLEAVREAAGLEQAPVILGFGCAMLDRTWLDDGGIEALAALGRVAAERAKVPVALLLNEAQTLDQAMRGLDAGFNAVMLDTSAWPREEALVSVRQLVAAARPRGAAVEAELGRLPDATELGVDASRASLTDPEEAAAFVAGTGVDCLAVSIGNIHLLAGGRAPVDLARLAAIRERVPVPLAIHGGSGFPPELVPEAIAAGAVKFNVGTVLKQVFLDAVLNQLRDQPAPVDVHAVLGSHKPDDVLVAGGQAMAAKVREFLQLYGSSGRTDD